MGHWCPQTKVISAPQKIIGAPQNRSLVSPKKVIGVPPKKGHWYPQKRSFVQKIIGAPQKGLSFPLKGHWCAPRQSYWYSGELPDQIVSIRERLHRQSYFNHHWGLVSWRVKESVSVSIAHNPFCVMALFSFSSSSAEEIK